MEERQAKFNECFSDSGGELTDLSYFGWFAQYLSEIIQSYNEIYQNQKKVDPNFPTIYVGIVDNRSINSTVAIYQNHYFIGIHTGLILSVADLFSTLLSDYRVAHDIGDIKKERESVDYVKLIQAQESLKYYSTLEDIPRGYVFMGQFPVDPVRQQYAMYCIDLALDFIIGHGAHHILLGHMDFLKEITGQCCLQELPYAHSRLDPKTYGSLELHADMWGVSWKWCNPSDRPKDISRSENFLRVQTFTVGLLLLYILGPENKNIPAQSNDPPLQFIRFHHTITSFLSMTWLANVFSEEKENKIKLKAAYDMLPFFENLCEDIETSNYSCFVNQLESIKKIREELFSKLENIKVCLNNYYGATN